MTNATLAFAVALLGWAPLVVLLAWRLHRLRRDLNMVMRSTAAGEDALRSEVAHLRAAVATLTANERTNALDICRIGDEHVETRGYVMGHARALDAHDERLITLERDSEEVRTAYFKTAATVEDHGDRLDHVEQYAPEP